MLKHHLLLLSVLLLCFSRASASPEDTQDQQAANSEQSATLSLSKGRTIDSLKSIIKEAKHLPDRQAGDTLVGKAYLSWGEEIYFINPDTALILWHKAYDICKENLGTDLSGAHKKTYLSLLAEALNNIGAIYMNRGDVPTALEFMVKSLEMKEEMGNKQGVANSLNNLGYIYTRQGDIAKGLEYHLKSLKIKEELGDKEGIAISLNNLGYIYDHQDDIPKALEYYNRSFEILEEIGDKRAMAATLNNIGSIYKVHEDLAEALKAHQKSLSIKEEIGDKLGIATSLNNMGYIYYYQKNRAKAMECYQKSLKIYEEFDNKDGIAITLNNIGGIELDQGKVDNALKHGIRGLKIAREIGSPYLIGENAGLLSKVRRQQGNFKEALELYELRIQMGDSIKNEETQKSAIRQQTKYEFEKALLIKEQEDKEVRRKTKEVRQRRDNLQYSVILIALLGIGGLLSVIGKFSIPIRVVEGMIFFAFLLFFEFLLVLADPSIERWSGGAPGIKLLFNAGIAALIFPLHSLFEVKLKKRLVKSKNEIHEHQ